MPPVPWEAVMRVWQLGCLQLWKSVPPTRRTAGRWGVRIGGFPPIAWLWFAVLPHQRQWGYATDSGVWPAERSFGLGWFLLILWDAYGSEGGPE